MHRYHRTTAILWRQDLLTVADVSHNAHNATPRWLHSDGWQFSKHLHVLKYYTSHVFSDILYSMCELSGPISQFGPHEWTVASLDVVSKNRSHLGYTLTLQWKPTSYCSGLLIQEIQPLLRLKMFSPSSGATLQVGVLVHVSNVWEIHVGIQDILWLMTHESPLFINHNMWHCIESNAGFS